jgi:hypothetical protein
MSEANWDAVPIERLPATSAKARPVLRAREESSNQEDAVPQIECDGGRRSLRRRLLREGETRPWFDRKEFDQRRCEHVLKDRRRSAGLGAVGSVVGN